MLAGLFYSWWRFMASEAQQDTARELAGAAAGHVAALWGLLVDKIRWGGVGGGGCVVVGGWDRWRVLEGAPAGGGRLWLFGFAGSVSRVGSGLALGRTGQDRTGERAGGGAGRSEAGRSGAERGGAGRNRACMRSVAGAGCCTRYLASGRTPVLT